MSRTKTQYRPVFTLADLTYLRDTIAADETKEGKKLHHYLSVYIAKVNVGLASSAYTTQGKVALEEKLGLHSQDVEVGAGSSELYTAKLKAKLAIGGAGILSPEERYNYLAMQAMSDVSTLTEEERKEGEKLEIEVTGFSSGIFG